MCYASNFLEFALQSHGKIYEYSKYATLFCVITGLLIRYKFWGSLVYKQAVNNAEAAKTFLIPFLWIEQTTTPL